MPNEFLVFSSLGSLIGLTTATYLGTTALVAAGWVSAVNAKKAASIIAVVLALAFVALTDPNNWQGYVIGLVNAAMAFLAATGVSTMASAGTTITTLPVTSPAEAVRVNKVGDEISAMRKATTWGVWSRR